MRDSAYQVAFEHLVRRDRDLAGLTRRAREIIEAVCRADAALTVSEIADAIGLDRTGVSRLVIKMADAKLLRRDLDASDTRRTLVSPLPKARAIDGRVRAALSPIHA